MNQNIIILILLIASILFITNCKTTQKPTEEKKVENVNMTANELVGKRFEQQVEAPVNPEYGGINFIEFKSETEAHMKLGDIVSIYEYKVGGNMMTLVDEQTKRVFNMEFTTRESFIDKYGTYWTLVR